MKDNYLGEFQEIVLLTILVLETNAYGVAIQEDIKSRLNRNVGRGALHTALTRLDEKGFIRSKYGGATAVRGGRRKRFYTLTQKGKIAIQEARNIRETLWHAIPNFSLKINSL